jgi:hypothetical protein
VADLQERLLLKESVIADFRAAQTSAMKLRQDLETVIHTLEKREETTKKVHSDMVQKICELEQQNHILLEQFQREDQVNPSVRQSKPISVGNVKREDHGQPNPIPPPARNTASVPIDAMQYDSSQTQRKPFVPSERSHWGKIDLEKLPKFNGQHRLISEWWDEIESLGALYAIPPSNMVMALPTMLQGPAKDWLQAEAKSLVRLHGHNWLEWKKAMFERFHDEDKRNEAIIEYLTLNFKNFKSIKRYMSQKYYLRSKAYGDNMPADQHESILITQTLQLFPNPARTAIKTAWMEKCMKTGFEYRSTPMSWQQFTRLVEDLLSTNMAIQQHDPCVLAHRQEGPGSTELKTTKEKPAEAFNVRCRYCGSNDHATPNCVASKDNKLFCTMCQRTNHTTDMHRTSTEPRSHRPQQKTFIVQGTGDMEDTEHSFPNAQDTDDSSDEDEEERNFL